MQDNDVMVTVNSLKAEDVIPQDLMNYMQQLREQQEIKKDYRAKASEIMDRQKNMALIQTANGKSRRWEQKLVQIKTMEGEFSVTMWASQTSDDEYSNLNDNETPISNVVSTVLMSPSQTIGDEQIEEREKKETVLHQQQHLFFQQQQEQFMQLQQQMTVSLTATAGTDTSNNRNLKNLNCESNSNRYGLSTQDDEQTVNVIQKQALKQKENDCERSSETGSASGSAPFGLGVPAFRQGMLVVQIILIKAANLF